MRELVVLHPANVAATLGRADVQAAVPQLRGWSTLSAARAPAGDCPPCQRRRRLQQQTGAANEALALLAALGSADKLKLKQVLRARKLRLRYRAASNQDLVLTF